GKRLRRAKPLFVIVKRFPFVGISEIVKLFAGGGGKLDLFQQRENPEAPRRFIRVEHPIDSRQRSGAYIKIAFCNEPLPVKNTELHRLARRLFHRGGNEL